jgi:hypothetical protein
MGWPRAGDVVRGGMKAWMAFARDERNDVERIAAALLWLDDLGEQTRQSSQQRRTA